MPNLSADDTPRSEQARARGLLGMRLIATGLLVLMAAIFVAASLVASRWAWAPYVRAFSEAGVVGACADWFAVTALFRRPLGLPIPHTGIIPRNKARIGQGLGGFIAENFLTARVLEARIDDLRLARWGGAWLGRRENADRLARRVTALIPEVLRALPPAAMREALEAAVSGAARAIPAAPLASRFLAAAWSEGRAQRLLDRGVEWLAATVVRHKPAIRSKVSEHSYRWLPGWIDRMIADKIVSGLIEIVEEMRDPGHPWRRELAEAVETFIARLATDPALRERGEAIKARLLADPFLIDHLTGFLTNLEAGPVNDRDSEFTRRLAGILLALGVWLNTNQVARKRLNDAARMLVRRVVAPRRHQIGVFVAQVVASWDTRSIVDKLELQVGGDLQYIRINGTLVGGLVGLIIFQLARWFGLS